MGRGPDRRCRRRAALNRAAGGLLGRFRPSIGGEIRNTRPAVVVSNDVANRLLHRVRVLPLTSRADRLYPGEAFVTLEGQRRKAMADQITTASKLRFRGYLGVLDPVELTGVERAVRIQLAL